MSRIIKFRAWSDKANKMVFSEEGRTWYLNTKGTLFYGGGVTRQGGPSTENFAFDSELMQFTGLTDLNGVDIYEGDVIKSINNKHYWLYVVKAVPNFGGMLWACMYENNLSICDIKDVYTYKKQRVKLGSRRDFVTCRNEVIGNIYQNPELLK